MWRQGESGCWNHVNKARCDGGRSAAEGLGAEGQSMGSTYCWQETAPISTMLRCSGLLGQAMGWDRWCRLWDIGVRCCTVVVVSWLLQTDSDGIPYHAYLGTRAADIHIKTHIHTAAPINRSISQSARPCFSPSQSVAADRVVSCPGRRQSPPRSAPQPQVSTRWPGPPIAARTSCAAVLLPFLRAVAFHLGLGGWAGAGRTRAVRTIPGRVREGLFTDTVCNELVVRGGDDRQLLHATRG